MHCLLPRSLASSSTLASFFWRNADLGALQNLPELSSYDPRYDPTVIVSAAHGQKESQSLSIPDKALTESPRVDHIARISDYVTAFKTKRVTPRDVVEKVLEIIDKDSRFKSTFLSVQREEVLRLADASTKRYEAGEPLGPLDGVPLAVKGKS